jgi:quinol monooxygenase YgiN
MDRWEGFLMRGILCVLLGLATMPIAAAPAQDSKAYVVTYIEVAPAAKDQAATLMRELAERSRKEAGVARFEILQRIDRPHHFAILEVWSDQGAQAAHAAAAHTKTFRDKLVTIASAPYDERPHTGLAAAPVSNAPAPQGALYAVTHVDFIPPKKDEGIVALKDLVAPSRQDAGNVRFDVLQQTSRQNHLTVVEIWRDLTALDGHAVAAHTKRFRDQLLPMSGSLFDERLYRILN